MRVPTGWELDRLVLNCLPPQGVTRPKRAGFVYNYPAEVQRRVLQHWESDGLPADLKTRVARASEGSENR